MGWGVELLMACVDRPQREVRPRETDLVCCVDASVHLTAVCSHGSACVSGPAECGACHHGDKHMRSVAVHCKPACGDWVGERAGGCILVVDALRVSGPHSERHAATRCDTATRGRAGRTAAGKACARQARPAGCGAMSGTNWPPNKRALYHGRRNPDLGTRAQEDCAGGLSPAP